MLRRLVLGLTEGLVIGFALGVACARGFGLVLPGNLVLLLLGALAGFATGLVAGRPVWARNAKTEALLKAAAGAVAGLGLSFALRRWLSVPVDLSAFSLGVGPAGQLSTLTLPMVTTLLALFFELDDDSTRAMGQSAPRGQSKQRVDAEMLDEASLDNPELPDDEVDHKLEKH